MENQGQDFSNSSTNLNPFLKAGAKNLSVRPFSDTPALEMRFQEEGYLLVPPEVVFSGEEVKELLRIFDQRIPAYISGRVDPSASSSHKDPRFVPFGRYDENVSLYGCATEHRLTRGYGSADPSKDDNFLYGKRATLPERKFPKELCRFVEHPKLLEWCAKLLGCKELSFINGSIAAVYPGCVGEPGQFHIDTPAFLPSSLSVISPSRYVINAFILLDDVDDLLAPVRIIPRSHSRYTEINQRLSKSLKLSSAQNNVPQAGQLWEELLPEDLEAPIRITGKAGTIVFMNSTVLHSATENLTKDRTRKVMVLNFSNREHTEFAKRYDADPSGCRMVYDNFQDKKLVERTFLLQSRQFTLKRTRRLLGHALRTAQKEWKTPLRPLARELRKVLQTPKNIEEKRHLNIGAGSNWRHPDVICLDFDPKGAEVAMDLNHRKPLPFWDNRFDGIYSSHCLEHLKEDQVRWWASEALRTLKSGGVFRVSVPNIPAYFDAYDSKNAAYFDWIRGRDTHRFDSWLRLIVRAFAEPVVDQYTDEQLKEFYRTKSREDFIQFFSQEVNALSDEKRMIPHAHKSWWSPQKMTALLSSVGFSKVSEVGQFESELALFREGPFNRTRPEMSFFVEAKK